MFGYDPEVPAGYQDADIEMLELAEAADDPNGWACEYLLVSGCTNEAVRQGVCDRHYRQEQREMAEARRR
jgi:hypothetical protein